MSSIMQLAVDIAIEDLRQRSKRSVYLNDPVLWAEEVLGAFLWSGQKEVLRSLVTHKKTAVKSCHSIGKDLPLNTPIPTPDGWKTMGDLRVGDRVFGADGKPTTVMFVSEDMHTVNYELTFSDGTTIVAGADHQWNTLDMTARSRVMSRTSNVDWRDHWDQAVTRTTQEIVDTLRTSGGQINHLIPVNAPVEYPAADLPIDPYTFGAWLGDGAKGAAYLYADADGKHILDKVEAQGYTITKMKSDPYGYSFSKGHGVVRKQLRALGVYKNKHIPTQYLQSSVNQRRQLLAGIMDTDGFVVNTASAGIDLANRELAYGVAELIRSLGVKVNVREGAMSVSGRLVPGTRYRLAFTPTFNPFGVGGHKHAKFDAGKISRSRATGRTITAARVVPTVTSRCIQVDNTDSLYLATEHFIPTHNTYLSAVAACWWISTRDDCMVQTSAPTYHQVHGLLWEEIRKMHAANNLPGRILDKDVWKRDWAGIEIEVGVGKKPADSNIHGFHGTHRTGGVLVILDEGCGIPVSIYTASDAITTAPMDRVLTVGNPDDPNTEFGRIFNQPTGEWNLITVSAYDTPNFTGEEIPDFLKKSLPQPEWVESRRREWGEDSARFLSKVLAQFPEQGSDAFFSQMAIDTAYDLELPDDLDAECVLGVDVAAYGDNYSVIYSNRGGRVRQHDRWAGGNALESADRIDRAARETNATEVRIDGSGFGSAIVDLVTERAGDTYRVIKVLGGASSQDIMKHANARAEQFDHLRDQMLKGHIDLDRTDVELAKQLLALKYKFTQRGGIQIESKKDMANRGAPSPDELDGVVYATLDTSRLLGTSEIDNLSPGDRLFLDMEDLLGGNPSWYLGF